MSKIKITEEDIKKVEDSSEKTPKLSAQKVSSDDGYSKLLKELDDIAKKYEFPLSEKTVINPEIKLERKTFVEPTDDEIKKQAQDSLMEYKNATKNKIQSENKLAVDNISKEIEEIKNSAENNKITTNSYYDKAKQDAENDALKRGLSRSSIIINTLSAFDQNRIDKLNAIDKKLTNQIDALNNQIDILSLEKEKALNDFDIEYASKLNSKISDLKSELQNRKNEVIEYNNKIEEIEREYQKDAIKLNNQAISDTSSELANRIKLLASNSDDVKKAKESENYTAVINFLNSMDPSQAMDFVQNNQYIRQMLGSQFSAVLAYLKRKA